MAPGNWNSFIAFNGITGRKDDIDPDGQRGVTMSWDEVCESVCSIARSLSVVGDRWTLPILHELAVGSQRFDEIQAHTGMSSFLLSTRLKRLEKDGVIERRLYSERPPGLSTHHGKGEGTGRGAAHAAGIGNEMGPRSE